MSFSKFRKASGRWWGNLRGQKNREDDFSACENENNRSINLITVAEICNFPINRWCIKHSHYLPFVTTTIRHKVRIANLNNYIIVILKLKYICENIVSKLIIIKLIQKSYQISCHNVLKQKQWWLKPIRCSPHNKKEQ